MKIVYFDKHDARQSFIVDSVAEGLAWLKAFKADNLFAAFIY